MRAAKKFAARAFFTIDLPHYVLYNLIIVCKEMLCLQR